MFKGGWTGVEIKFMIDSRSWEREKFVSKETPCADVEAETLVEEEEEGEESR